MRKNKDYSVLKNISELIKEKKKFRIWLTVIGAFAVVVMISVGFGIRIE
mgnify:CR=1 FL=1